MSAARARLPFVAALLAALVTGAVAHADGPLGAPPPVAHAALPAPRPAITPRPPLVAAAPHDVARTSATTHVRARTDVHLPARVATPSLEVPVPPVVARQQLLAVRDEVARRAQTGERPVVIFDIDDTLLTWPRPDLPERQLVPGALTYLTSLKEAGAKIVYITGRHSPAREETIAQLHQFGFPVGNDEQLVLNDTKLGTVEYKSAATRVVVRDLGRPVAVFDNEMENARMFRRELPDPRIAVVRLRTTTQRPDSGGDGPITVIDDFRPALPTTIHLTRSQTVAPVAAP